MSGERGRGMSKHPGPNHPAIRTGQGTMRHKVSEQADVPLRPCAAASAIASSITRTRYGELFTLCPGLHCEPRKPLRDSAGGFGPVTRHVLSFLALDIWMSRPCPDSQLHSVAFRLCMACCEKGEAGQQSLSSILSVQNAGVVHTVLTQAGPAWGPLGCSLCCIQ